MLLAARAVQGAGGALAAPAALALLSTIFTEGPERVRAIGLYTTVSAAGGAAGLVAGGLLTEWTSWRWVMFVNVPIGLAVLGTGRIVLDETTRRPGRFDLPGAVTSTAGVAGVVLGLVEAGSKGWGANITIASLTAGAILMAAFIRIEATADEPILPLRILANRNRAVANGARGLGYAGLYGMVFFLTQFLQDIQHHSALLTGIGFLPAPASVFVASQLTSKVLMNRVPAKVLMLSGSALSALGLLLLTQLHAGTPYPQVLVSLILIGAGMGVSFVSLTSVALTGVAPADAGAASGLINVVQQLGAALGLAVLVTVFDGVSGPGHSSGLTQATAAVDRGALIHGLDVTFAAGAVFALAALALVSTLRRRAGDQPALAAEGADVDLEVEAAA
jgi:MFS family permease